MANAATCKITTMNVAVPSPVTIGESVEIDTRLDFTCTATNDNILARVDISLFATSSIISSKSIEVGAIPLEMKAWNISIPNSVKAPLSEETWSLIVRAWIFVGVQVQAQSNQTISLQVQTPRTEVTTSTSIRSQLTGTTTNATTQSQSPILPVASLLVTFTGISGVTFLMIMRKRKKRPSEASQPTEPSSHEVPTGYSPLDIALRGGLPVGYGIIVVSPPFDERDLLLGRIISSYHTSGFSVFFLSHNLARTGDLAKKYVRGFYAFNPQADKIQGDTANIFKIQGVLNLNDLNIALAKTIESIPDPSQKRVLILDLLSDILLEHKALTTRKWLDDFLAKRKAEGFTVLATLNPLVVSDQERQTIVDLFDGVIDIYERLSNGKSKRFALVRKMYAKRCTDSAIELQKDQLF